MHSSTAVGVKRYSRRWSRNFVREVRADTISSQTYARYTEYTSIKGETMAKAALVGTVAHGYHGIAPWNGLDDPFAALIARYIFAARYARLINEFPYWRSNDYA